MLKTNKQQKNRIILHSAVVTFPSTELLTFTPLGRVNTDWRSFEEPSKRLYITSVRLHTKLCLMTTFLAEGVEEDAEAAKEVVATGAAHEVGGMLSLFEDDHFFSGGGGASVGDGWYDAAYG